MAVERRGTDTAAMSLVVAVAGILLQAAAMVADAQTLKLKYYDVTCPAAESIVFDEVQKAWNADRSIPASLIRLHFHDCFVNGCDGSVLLEAGDGQAEKNAKPNLSLRGYEVVDRVKARLEATCKQTVSCADILAYAARDSVRVMTGGYKYEVPGGRPDGMMSRATMTSDLPPPTQRNVDVLAGYFTKKGLSMDDMVVLSGAHTLGVAKCGTFGYRLTSDSDNGIDAAFRNDLRRQCHYNPNNVVALDAGSQYAFDTSYYANVLANRTVLESDAALASTETRARVWQLRTNPGMFMSSFGTAMVKMGGLRGNNPGKIRDNCRRVRTPVSTKVTVLIRELSGKLAMASSSSSSYFQVVAVTMLLMATSLQAQLRVGFYDNSCPAAEIIVQQEVSKAVSANPGLAAGLVRLHFHDCFVRGCDASVLIDSTKGNTAEKDAGPNTSLRGFDVVDKIKARVEQACFGVVSCADILAFAARDSVALTGGNAYQVPAGRRDGTVSRSSDTNGNLPPPTASVSQMTQIFSSKGLSQKDMVALSGAHTIGASHCSSFSSRLYSSGTTANGKDPTMDPSYLAQLANQCPQSGAAGGTLVALDAVTPNAFDEGFFKGVMANRGLLASDQALLGDKNTAVQVVMYANDPSTFQSDFAAAMVKMGAIGVLTGGSGKVRANCRVA
uniref:Peroxidase 1 n=1 Tax=Leersia perrieri TaxID=77586 RepID=A0A0D9XLX0_9ORYZ